jgi:hypothetical protein
MSAPKDKEEHGRPGWSDSPIPLQDREQPIGHLMSPPSPCLDACCRCQARDRLVDSLRIHVHFVALFGTLTAQRCHIRGHLSGAMPEDSEIYFMIN